MVKGASFRKKILRTVYFQKRLRLSVSEITKKSLGVARKTLQIPEVNGKKNIAIYLPINCEVDTKLIINTLLQKGVNIFIPKYFEKNDEYRFVKFVNWQELEKGPYGIPQPKQAIPAKTGQLEIAFIPAVAFSKNGVRLGYGKGIFDKLLSNSPALKIGLAFDFQIVDELPQEEHDLIMDLIITEKRIIRITPTR